MATLDSGTEQTALQRVSLNPRTALTDAVRQDFRVLPMANTDQYSQNLTPPLMGDVTLGCVVRASSCSPWGLAICPERIVFVDLAGLRSEARRPMIRVPLLPSCSAEECTVESAPDSWKES